jgi:Predicted pyridoxal phosphate-dependent enzyme apparently involved in regulation of cell wall biogenesis
LKAKHVIALNSCTSALHLGALVSGLTDRDFFIVPTYTFVSSVEIGEYIGAQPLLVDIDEKTMNLDLNQVEDYLNKYGQKIKTIIPVHLAGNPVKMNELRNLSESYGCFLLEDAAHALEAIDNGKKIGNTEDAATFSFYANKNITTGGEGGAIATNNSFLAEKLKKLSLHGMNKDGWSRYSSKGRWSYDIDLLGYKVQFNRSCFLNRANST